MVLSPAAERCREKMRAANVNEVTISNFLHIHSDLTQGKSCFLAESAISPIENLLSYEDLPLMQGQNLIDKVAIIKLNGGLGTGMGLSTAKSLLPIRDGKTFLDFIISQINFIENEFQKRPFFLLMNSFSTFADTKEFIKKYPSLYDIFDDKLSFMQSKVCKIRQDNLYPVEVESNPSFEWAPPGHGDVYAALYSSGKLQKLIESGVEYAFISNSDNLGAVFDPNILSYVIKHKIDFLMEVAQRTCTDRKGGHLCKDLATGRLLIREIAQCNPEDQDSFQDTSLHRYFSTNNLWISLSSLQKLIEKNHGSILLPGFINAKTVNPCDSSSAAVYQLETSMGSAIQLFENSVALLVPRDRFAPVKTCDDLLRLRSDVYTTLPSGQFILDSSCSGIPPDIKLDKKWYKYINQLDKAIHDGIPSLIRCRSLQIKGQVAFGKGVIVEGDVIIEGAGENELPLRIEHCTLSG